VKDARKDVAFSKAWQAGSFAGAAMALETPKHKQPGRKHAKTDVRVSIAPR
jgi:hypothetical protein